MSERRQFSDTFKIQLINQITEGRKLQDLCEEHKIRDSVVRRWLRKHKAGTLVRDRPDKPIKRSAYQRHTAKLKAKSRLIDPSIRLAAEQELTAGATVASIARKFGVTQGAVSYWKTTMHSRNGAGVPVARNGNGHANGKTVAVTIEPGIVASRDATIFLRKAKSELLSGIRAGKIHDFDNVHLMSMLALNSLTGGK